MKMIAKVLSFCVILTAESAFYVNDYDEPFAFSCPQGQSISNIRSRHNNHHEDRRYGFSCRSSPGLGSCSWSASVNDFDDPILYQCPGNGVITGIASYHNNRREDRRFRFCCCSIANMLTRCTFSGYVNAFDGYFSYNVLSDRVLRGVSSHHNNHHEDRRYKFETCVAN